MTTRYKVHCRPSFHPEMEIEVLFEDEGELIRVQSEGRTAQAPLSVAQGVAFLEAMEALAPDSIANGWEGGIDGCFFTCSVQNARGAVHTFSAWNPQPGRSPSQYAFISLVHGLAVDTIREPVTANLLKQLGATSRTRRPAPRPSPRPRPPLPGTRSPGARRSS